MSLQAVARRYASALADVAVAQGEERAVQNELLAWERMVQSSPELREVFRNPTIPYEQKLTVLNQLIARTDVRQTAANFLRVLLRNQRLGELGEVNRRFVQVLDERAGVVAAHVTSAREVPEETKSALREKLAAMTGKDVRVTFDTDESLIGGMVTRIHSTIYDGSVRNQLEQLKEKLTGQ